MGILGFKWDIGASEEINLGPREQIGLHGFRSGAANDLAMAGGTFAEVLQLGDWSSAAYKVYLKLGTF